MFHKNLIQYAVILLFKDKADHLFSFIIFTFIVTLLSGVLFISDAIQSDLKEASLFQPDIVVENTLAGRAYKLMEEDKEAIESLTGVTAVDGVVDGYYYFAQGRVWFHIIGDSSLSLGQMRVGSGVQKAIHAWHYDDVFNFFTLKGKITLKIEQIESKASDILCNDVMYMHPANARAVLDLNLHEYSKLYVTVPNPNEVGELALKIVETLPSVKATSKEEMMAHYQHLFYYKGGLFMILYLVCLVSFLILLKNQISLVYGEKKKEIAILRSIGYGIKDIIAIKFIQNSVVSLGAFLSGVFIAYAYVFVFQAPLLRSIFLGTELEHNVEFTPVIDMHMLFLLFLFSVIPFLACVILPSWKIAIADMSEAVR
ncbi:ABC transporter permease [Sulfurospirillum barnesii]|uniref:ABC-type transport system, involved in lipoprotein release, permease component n=1 Tax=Sulfurospirillum barnesii (strain ATCC 700032 / DSM 10660 / SES-3) TaxID=760154 RepID=I3XVU2_SULBS|nr:FtsX-like permease family protein [Sulfurospirillum barnesii]AFL68066.1 ABC-type transport system, involved in lipoprotein release, permease component [Sulfurospirillum barnesii SES-3]